MSRAQIISLAAAAVICVCPLSGCMTGSPGDGYSVISDGTAAELPTEAAPAQEEETLYIPENMVTKYASLSYSDRMQKAYDSVVSTMVNFETKSHIPITISDADYANVLETVRCEQLMLFYLENRTPGDFDIAANAYEMSFTYKFSVSEVNEMLRETEEAAKKIIALTDDSMSDYEKLKVFHDYLVLNVESSVDDAYVDSVYGALVKGKALCEGYAKAFSYLCNIAGIENMIVTGYTGVDHMWNMVKLEGKWYHIDIGWDKPAEALAANYPDMILYQYFLADDTVIKNNREINDLLCSPPKADCEEMNYFIFENRYARTYQDALDIIERSVGKCMDAGEKYFMLKFDSSNLCLKTTAELIKKGESGASDIDRIVERLGFKGKISYIDYYKQYRILIFVIE